MSSVSNEYCPNDNLLFIFDAVVFRLLLKSWIRPRRRRLPYHLLHRFPWSPQPLPPRLLLVPPDSSTTLRKTPSPTFVLPTLSWTFLRWPPGPAPAPSNPSLRLYLRLPTLLSSPKSLTSRRGCRPLASLQPLLRHVNRHLCSRCTALLLRPGCSRWCMPRRPRPCRPNLEALPPPHLHYRSKSSRCHDSQTQTRQLSWQQAGKHPRPPLVWRWRWRWRLAIWRMWPERKRRRKAWVHGITTRTCCLLGNQVQSWCSSVFSQMEVEVNVAPSTGATSAAAAPNICIRAGCTNPAVESKDWDMEYCSNECVATHCRCVHATAKSVQLVSSC